MRISGWSSDVCSSDLVALRRTQRNRRFPRLARPDARGFATVRGTQPLQRAQVDLYAGLWQQPPISLLWIQIFHRSAGADLGGTETNFGHGLQTCHTGLYVLPKAHVGRRLTMAERRLFEDVVDTIRRLILDGTYQIGRAHV